MNTIQPNNLFFSNANKGLKPQGLCGGLGASSYCRQGGLVVMFN